MKYLLIVGVIAQLIITFLVATGYDSDMFSEVMSRLLCAVFFYNQIENFNS